MARIQVLGFSVHRFLAGLASSGLAVGLALIVGAFLIGFVGVNPFSAYLTMLDGSFRNLHTVSEMLVKVSPQILASLSFLLAFRCGLFNIGAEGQIYVGGLFVTVLGIYAPSDWPPALLVPLGFCAGFLGGGIWGGIAGFLKARFRVHEIVSTIMMNYIAIFLIKYMVEGPLQEASGAFPQTDMIADGAQLPLILLPTRAARGILPGDRRALRRLGHPRQDHPWLPDSLGGRQSPSRPRERHLGRAKLCHDHDHQRRLGGAWPAIPKSPGFTIAFSKNFLAAMDSKGSPLRFWRARTPSRSSRRHCCSPSWRSGRTPFKERTEFRRRLWSCSKGSSFCSSYTGTI